MILLQTEKLDFWVSLTTMFMRVEAPSAFSLLSSETSLQQVRVKYAAEYSCTNNMKTDDTIEGSQHKTQTVNLKFYTMQ